MSIAPVRHAWRSLARTPVFTVAAVLTLVLGIGASVAIFNVLHGVLLRPLPFGEPDRLVGVWHALPGVNIGKGNHTIGTYLTYQRLARTIESIALYQESAVNVSARDGLGEPQRVRSASVTATLIPTMQVAPLLGRNFTEAEDLPNGPLAVIISEGVWRTRFGADPNIVGQIMDVSGRSREIVGVMPERFRYPTAETQLWLPLQIDPNAAFSDGFSYNGVARLKPGVSPADAARDLATVLPRMTEIFPMFAPGVPTQMLLDQAKPAPLVIPLRQDITGDIARTLWMVAAAAGLVLLVACANVANLILVRADGRQRELAVREALGAGRARVLTFFLGESLLLAGLAGVLGLGVAWVALRALVSAGPADIPRLAELRLDASTVAFTLVIVLVVAVLCSIVPALRVGRVPLATALREGGRGGTAGKAQHRLRGAMVAVQMALALVVLAGSGLLLRTFQRLNAVRPGFDPANVATFWVSLPPARYAGDSAVVRFHAQLLDRVSALPGVRGAGLTSRLPLLPYGTNQSPFYREGDASAQTQIPPLQLYTTVDAGYFRAMGIPVLAGRTFAPLGVQVDNEVIISQRTAEQFFSDPTGRAALGKRFQSLPGGPWFTIIGVAGSVHDTSLAAPASQAVYFPQAVRSDTLYGNLRRTMALVVRTTGDPASIIGPVHGVLRELDPALPTYEVRSMNAVVRGSIAELSFTIVMLGAAAVTTLVLGAIGLYGVLAYLVTLRTRELGVRLALGATPGTVAAMMTRQGLALAAVGLGAGLVLFAVVARFLRSFLYGVAPSDPVTLAAAVALLIGIAALASWVPARRAARVDPATTLRSE